MNASACFARRLLVGLTLLILPFAAPAAAQDPPVVTGRAACEGPGGAYTTEILSDLQGRLQFRQIRDGAADFVAWADGDSAWALVADSGRWRSLDDVSRARVIGHDFAAIALGERTLFDDLTEVGDSLIGRDTFGRRGSMAQDTIGRVVGFRMIDPRSAGDATVTVRFEKWTSMDGHELPATVIVEDAGGSYRLEFNGWRKATVAEEMDLPGSSVRAADIGLQSEAEFDTGLRALVEAERAFARLADEAGMRAAFLAWLAEDAVAFLPTPVAARPAYEGMDPVTQPRLEWRPARAELSADGDLGWQTGPWRLTRAGATDPDLRGDYLSLWRRGEDGQWRVLVDLGVQSRDPRPLPTTAVGRRSSPHGHDESEASDVLLDGLERELTELVQERGGLVALEQLAVDDLHLLRDGEPGRAGRRWIAGLSESVESGPWTSTLSGSALADSGDLAAGWGTQKGADGAGSATFFRAWRKEEGRWRLLVDARAALGD